MSQEYGLTGLRDRDGELRPVEYTFEFGGETLTIKFHPPTLAEQEELENLDEDEPASEMASILDDYMIKPQIPDDGSWTAREMNAYLTGILQWSMGGTDLGQEIEEEIDERTASEGN